MSNSDEAFTAAYHWQGEPITWSKRHHWNWHTIASVGGFTTEQSAMLCVWLGMMDMKGLRQLESDWRLNAEIAFEEFAQFTAGYLPEGQETRDAIKLLNLMFDDIENSKDEIEADDEGEGGGPKKSAPTQSTPTNSNQFSHA